MPKLNANEIDRYLNSRDKRDNRRSKPNRSIREDNESNYNKKNDNRRPTSRNKQR